MPLKPNSKKVDRKFSQRRQDSKGKFLNERASNSESDSAMSNNGNQEQEMQPEEQKNGYAFSRHGIRSNYMDKSIEAKKKVIRMLFVIIVVSLQSLYLRIRLVSLNFYYRSFSCAGVHYIFLTL